MPGIPAADPNEGFHYLAMLKLLRAALPDKEISVCAPASYWYLQHFPIKQIGEISDYVIYMTYDLHGQVSGSLLIEKPSSSSTSASG
jgi:GH18 family chitinase